MRFLFKHKNDRKRKPLKTIAFKDFEVPPEVLLCNLVRTNVYFFTLLMLDVINRVN